MSYMHRSNGIQNPHNMNNKNKLRETKLKSFSCCMFFFGRGGGDLAPLRLADKSTSWEPRCRDWQEGQSQNRMADDFKGDHQLYNTDDLVLSRKHFNHCA